MTSSHAWSFRRLLLAGVCLFSCAGLLWGCSKSAGPVDTKVCGLEIVLPTVADVGAGSNQLAAVQSAAGQVKSLIKQECDNPDRLVHDKLGVAAQKLVVKYAPGAGERVLQYTQKSGDKTVLYFDVLGTPVNAAEFRQDLRMFADKGTIEYSADDMN